MRRISGGAVWSNRPRTDLARAPVEQSAGATLRTLSFEAHPRVDIIRKIFSSILKSKIGHSFIELKLNDNNGLH
jgi:hypothetical protein